MRTTIKSSDNSKIHLQNYGLNLKWGQEPDDKLFGVVCRALYIQISCLAQVSNHPILAMKTNSFVSCSIGI